MHAFRFSLAFLLLAALFGCSRKGQPTTPEPYITSDPEEGAMTLVENGTACPVLYSSGDFAGVFYAATDLTEDLERVTGTLPLLIPHDSGTVEPAAECAILVGTLGKSPLIDHLVESGLLEVGSIKGKWESSVTALVDDPLPGIGRALVIAGSDKRGTIYGIYEMSSQIGVSPWYFWADVTPQQKDALYVRRGLESRILGEPAVKYRGIFINDEAPALSGWVEEHYGSFNHDFYETVFELILRMKGNFLWPAMWGRAFYDDDPENARLANEYGVVIGTTHHEPMMRAHVEWARYGNGPWDYRVNRDTLQKFWREGIARMGQNESIVSLGMRGDGDEPMTEGTAIALLEQIVKDQRAILEEVTGKPAEETPQLWALYKEVQDYYDKGMRVPGDVTLLLSDDNWGNLRKLPRPGSPPRPGGYGIYYHFDYVGGPRNYKWLNTNQIERVWEQMHMAWEHGVDRIWIVNVGDIKPMELPIQFFLDLAWGPGSWNVENLHNYYTEWSRQQFGERFAGPVGDILALYTKYNARRKPELLSPDTYSLPFFREAERVVSDYRELEDLAVFVGEDIPEELKDAYFELVLFPVKACANLNELYYAAALNRQYASQGRASTSAMADTAAQLFAGDSLLTRQYHQLAGGKWDHMMSQTHIGYTWWQEPRKNRMPAVETLDPPVHASMGVVVEQIPPAPASGPGSSAISGSAAAGSPGTESPLWQDRDLRLPVFDPVNDQNFYIEIFNRGTDPFLCTLEPSENWIRLPAEPFTVKTGYRVYVTIDWTGVPEGMNDASILIHGPDGQTARVALEADHRDRQELSGRRELFVAGNGIVSMEAVHYQRKKDGRDCHWVPVPNLGRTLSSMITLPSVAPPSEPGGRNSPRLEYDFFLDDTGTFNLEMFFSPTLRFYDNAALRFAFSLDGQAPETIPVNAEEHPGSWNDWVSNNIIRKQLEVSLSAPGIHTLKYWRIDPGVVLQKTVITKKGTDDPTYLGPPESLLLNREPPSPD